MYLLYTDETNLHPRDGEFFVYGGIAVPSDSAALLSEKLEAIRTAAKMPLDYLFKFNPGPTGLSHAEFIEAKKAVIQAACDTKCVFICSVILHSITTSAEDARRNEINRVAYHFHCYLARPNDKGLVLIDRFTDKQLDSHLREKFSVGIKGMPYSKTIRLDRILGFHYAAIGQSHFTSLIDIVIGSMRFAVNAYSSTDENIKQTAQTILRQLSPLLFREKDRMDVSPLSINFSPNIIKAATYRGKYEKLKAFFEAAGIFTAQPITDQRRY